MSEAYEICKNYAKRVRRKIYAQCSTEQERSGYGLDMIFQIIAPEIEIHYGQYGNNKVWAREAEIEYF